MGWYQNIGTDSIKVSNIYSLSAEADYLCMIFKWRGMAKGNLVEN